MVWTRRPNVLPLAADHDALPEPAGGWSRPTYYTQSWLADLFRLQTHPIWQITKHGLSPQMLGLIEGQDGHRLTVWEVADVPRGEPFALIVNPAYPPDRPICADVGGWIRYRPRIETNLVLLSRTLWVCGGGKRDHIAIRALAALRNGEDPFGRPVGVFTPEPGPRPPEDDAALSLLEP